MTCQARDTIEGAQRGDMTRGRGGVIADRALVVSTGGGGALSNVVLHPASPHHPVPLPRPSTLLPTSSSPRPLVTPPPSPSSNVVGRADVRAKLERHASSGTPAHLIRIGTCSAVRRKVGGIAKAGRPWKSAPPTLPLPRETSHEIVDAHAELVATAKSMAPTVSAASPPSCCRVDVPAERGSRTNPGTPTRPASLPFAFIMDARGFIA